MGGPRTIRKVAGRERYPRLLAQAQGPELVQQQEARQVSPPREPQPAVLEAAQVQQPELVRAPEAEQPELHTPVPEQEQELLEA